MNVMFKSKAYGAATVGERGQLVIPAGLRKTLKIKSGDQLMVFAKLDSKIINLIPEKEFSEFLDKAARLISKMENKAHKKPLN